MPRRRQLENVLTAILGAALPPHPPSLDQRLEHAADEPGDPRLGSAHARVYNLASDAMTDIDAAAHDVALTKIFPRMGEIDSTEALLALL